ncbi:MAG: ATP-binding cassette, subfamily bacterial PglK, partial [Candidatus Poribacteria bacterium]|nr:ATP-binding cassette, subfamily bacterial PglK [Candidatus Poribacteria bacterium]
MKTTFWDKLNNILTRDDKKYLLYLFVFTIFIAVIETLGVSVIMPFLTLANDLSLIHSNL